MRRISGLAFALYLAAITFFFFFLHDPNLSVYAAIIDLAFVLAAAVVFWAVAARAQEGPDRIWYRVSVGLLIWCLAIVLKVLERWLKQPEYATLADSFWIAGYFPMLSGSYLWFRETSLGRSKRLAVTIPVILAGGLILAAFQMPLFLDPVRPAVKKILDLLYVTFDLLIIGLLAVPAMKPAERGARTLMIAEVVFLVSDLLFIHFGESYSSPVFPFLDFPYTTGYYLLLLSGFKQYEQGHQAG